MDDPLVVAVHPDPRQTAGRYDSLAGGLHLTPALITHQRTVAAGAAILREVNDTDYGSHEFSCRDPEGNLWSFGTYLGEPR